MPQIGEFTREEFGFTGRIHTLTLYREITILPVEPSEVENAPNYRVHHGADDNAPEIGAAWTETSEKAGEYLSVLLDDPAWNAREAALSLDDLRHAERIIVCNALRGAVDAVLVE